MTRKQAGKILKIVEGLEHKNGSEYYRFGFDYFGPFLYGYTKWLYETTSAKGIDNILFFARDGYMMQKAYDRLQGGVKTQYVYFSRKSLRQALLCNANSFFDSIKYFSWKRLVSVTELLYFWGLDADDCLDELKSIGLSLNDEFKFDYLAEYKKLEQLYEVLKPVIDKRSVTQADYLLKYLRQIGINSNSAIVDIGWHGSMQYFLEEFLRFNGSEIKLKGFYVGIDPERDISGELYGYLFDKNDLSIRKSVLCFLGIYEKLFQCQEGSTTGYSEINGIVEATKAKYEYFGDKALLKAVEEMQSGGMDCFEILCNTDTGITDYREFATPLLLYGEKPSLKQALLFKDMYISDGIKSYFLPQKPLTQYKANEMKRELSNSCWKTGFMKAAFKVPFPYDWIYKVMRK